MGVEKRNERERKKGPQNSEGCVMKERQQEKETVRERE